MAITAFWFGKAFFALANKEIDWLADTIKVAMCTSAYTPARGTQDYFNDVTNEVTGTGYTAGGATLTSKTIDIIGIGGLAPTASSIITIDADDVTWSNSTVTARYAVVYDDTPVAAVDKPLIGYIDFGEDFISNDGDFIITWNSDGIATITIA